MKRLTEKSLLDWAGSKKFEEGRALFDRGTIEELSIEPPFVRAELNTGARHLRTGFRLNPDGSAESLCPCYDNRERGIICAHVVAVGLALRQRLNNPAYEENRRIEERRAARLAAVDDSGFHRRARAGENGLPVTIELELAAGWEAGVRGGTIPLYCRFRHPRDGARPMDDIPRQLPLTLSDADEALLFVLEDICEGPARGRVELSLADFFNVLQLRTGRGLLVEGHGPALVGTLPVASRLQVRMDREFGDLVISILPEAGVMNGAAPVWLVHRKTGWLWTGREFRPLLAVLPEPMHGIYQHAMTIPRMSVPRFLRAELPAMEHHLPVESEVTLDMLSIEPARPRFRLALRGSPASLSATLFAEYDGTALVAGKSDPAGEFAIPDAVDFLRYNVRNGAAEQEGLARLNALGFQGTIGDHLSPLIGDRVVKNFLARDYPALRRRGWKVDIQGRASGFLEETGAITPVVRILAGPQAPASAGPGWFEVSFAFEDSRGLTVDPAEIQRALRMGDSFIEKDGRVILFDAGAVSQLRDVFEDCGSGEGSRPGQFRMAALHAAYVKSSLDALDGVDVEADPAWQAAAERQGRRQNASAAPIPADFAAPLRPYQAEGVKWLQYLEQCGFAGILADEMGLGKTLQALTWLRLQRLNPEAQGRPALVICPTSLVENWRQEAEKFAPELKVQVVAGQDRHAHWEELAGAELIVTSYALLRRDVEHYEAMALSAVILDEAQHIKNRATRNAMAVKRVHAPNKLVLTGTPVENGVSDLWSIMDFLMPGYLGSHEAFRRRYEQPISQGGEDGEAAQARLRRKLEPFLMRRLKRDVAKELPPKIERTAWCSLTPDQREVYRQLLEASRRRITDMVAEKGFNASRMEILRTLLRLRQVCCHLDLLKLEHVQSQAPSAKLDLLVELLMEAMDGGHRVLIFSQFVSMLTLLRQEFERRGWTYAYLDGATQNRMDVVKRFNTDRSIPAFLISLKAGGTGLNLVGADMVIHYDPWWNPAVVDQATDRAYRIGQDRTVYSIKLIARDTVEEKVLALQRRKQMVIDATVRAGGRALQSMDWQDVKDLLDL